MAYRKKLEDLINENGGEYRGNLTRDVTHLIAKEPAGNKYTYAGQWGIKIVSIEWLQRSLERGMILDESLFHLLLPPAERGRNAWMRKTASTTSLGKRSREGGLERSTSRKLRRTASVRLSNESSGIWTNIVGDSIKQENEKPSEWHDLGDQALRANAGNDPTRILQTSGEQRFQGDPRAPERQESTKLLSARTGGVFEDTKVILHGFDEKRVGLEQLLHFCSPRIDLHVPGYYLATPSLFSRCKNSLGHITTTTGTYGALGSVLPAGTLSNAQGRRAHYP